MSYLLECQQVRVHYQQRCALYLAELIIPTHQSCVILGPNGSGKSTLLKLLNRDLYPAFHPQLRFRLLGKSHWSIFELRQQVGFISNEIQYRFIDDQALVEAVVLSGFFATNKLHNFNSVSPIQRRAGLRILADLQLADLINQPFGYLSTGQQRRVLLARCLVHKPHTLIMDEPTTGLDIKSSRLLLGLLQKLSEQGLAIILVTHRVQEILPSINRVLYMNRGRLVADGDQRLLNSRDLSRLFDCPVEIERIKGWYRLGGA